MNDPAAVLTPAERRVLEAVCDTLLPSLPPEPGDDPELFRLRAADVGIVPAMEAAFRELEPVQVRRLRQLLRLLDTRLGGLALTGKARPFTALPQAGRERLLLALATHRWGPLRRGFQGLKRLAAFLFYSLPDAAGHNPTWPPLHYTPSPNRPARAPALTLTAITRPTTLECDVCVIGSGAGGGVVAAELAAAGRRVVVLEAGSGQQAPDFDQREYPGTQRLYLDRAMASTHDLGIALLAGATLGGGTAVNWQTCLPLPAAVRDEWAETSGCRHFASESFTRSLDAVMSRLQVSTAESVVNANNAKLQQGCAALGYRTTPIARNAHGCDLEQCGYCSYGCRHGGKRSTAVTYLEDAQRHGATTIVAGCRAERVLLADGRATGVEAVATETATGRVHPVRVEAKLVVAAAGALHTPALLLRSGLRLPALGRYLYLHPTSAVAGQYDERIDPWLGPPQTVLCDEFAGLAGNYGVRFETAPVHPGTIALGCSWANAREHRRTLQQTAFTSVIIVLARDRSTGRVRLGSGGRPVAEYEPGAREQDHLRQGLAEAARIHWAAGARQVQTLHTRPRVLSRHAGLSPKAIEEFCREVRRAPVARHECMLFSAHQMGTCRMGSDPRTAVCDADGEVHGVRGLFIGDGSAFPASSGVNPMITIMALAHHTAQRIKGR